jgi:hypothetical protein
MQQTGIRPTGVFPVINVGEDYISGIVGGGTNIRAPLPPHEYMLTVNYRYGG